MAEQRVGKVREAILDRGRRETPRRDTPRRKPRTAFVLSGGGNLGAMQVGMLRALVERDVIPDVVLGCSIGAMNGAAFAADPTPEGVRRLISEWDAASTGEVMPPSRLPPAVQMLRRGSSIHDSAALRRTVTGMLGANETFEDLKIPFQCNAVDVESSISTWFSQGDLIEPILASAALPSIYPPVEIDGHTYIDGGVIENVPIGRAVELGCRTIYVLHLGPHGRPSHELRRPLDAALQAYWVARNSQFAKDLASLPDKVEAIVLPPGERPDIKRDDFSQTKALVERGYSNASKFLDEESVAARRRFTSEVLRPIERLVLNARSIKWRQQASDAANAPHGAVITGSDSEGVEPSQSDGETSEASEASREIAADSSSDESDSPMASDS